MSDTTTRSAAGVDETRSARNFAQPVPLTRPPIIVGLAMVFVLITIGFIAVLRTTVATSVSSTGVLLPGGQVYPVLSPTSGQLTNILVATKDLVSQGEQLAIVTDIGGSQSDVLAPITGNVLDLIQPVGVPVSAGSEVMLLAPAAPLQVTLDLPAEQASQVRVGMSAQVTALSTSVNNAGYATGTVSDIAPTGLAVLPGGDSPSTPQVAVVISFSGEPMSVDQLPWQGTDPALSTTAIGDAVSVRIITGSQSVAALLRGSGS